MSERGASRGGLPIAVQVGFLLMASLLAAQVLSVLLVFVTPPPPLPVYQLSEVAGALRGGPLDASMGPKLVRTTAAQPPAEPARHGFRDEITRRQLASLLQVPDTQVRFASLRGRRVVWMFARRPFARPFAGRPPPPEGFRPPPGPDGAPPPPPDAGPGPPPAQTFRRYRPGGAVFGGFTAALQDADGNWTIVRSPHEPFFNAWHRRILLWLFGCLVIVGPAAYLFARRITSPIDHFAKAAQALGRDPHAPPIELSGPAEIGEAARAFNDMQARIRRYVDDRTAMVGAISHDLRTPLARIRYKLEGAPEDLKTQVLSDVERMEQMIGQVLAFIREAAEPRRRERLDLLSVIECVVDDASLAGADVTIVKAHPAAVEGDGLQLQRMLTNLVDNADKYGTRARISLEQTDDEAVIRIEDDGPGLPETELERVFQPFYRPDAARTLDDGGVGLGLSVARSIARAHGGDIVLTPAPGRGLVATVRLPLAG